MGTTLIGEMRDGSGSVSVSGSALSFRSTIKYLVLADDYSVTREEVLFTEGLPVVGLLYGPAAAAVVSKDAQRSTEHGLYWEVTVQLDTGSESQKQSPASPSNDPTTWIPVFKIDSFETKERVLTLDRAGSVICNSAGDPFETPLTETFNLCSFSFTQYEDPGLDIDDILDRNNVVNETAFAGRAARTLKLNVTGAELGAYGGYAAWKITYRCTYDPDTWDVRILDYGSNYIDAGDRKAYMDDENLYKIYGPLNGTTGAKATDAAELTFETLEKVEFADFIRS